MGSPRLTISAGEVLADRYTVRGALGTGGFGVVYRVDDEQLKQELALKVVVAGADSAERALQSLVHEFKLRSRISDYSHIIRSYDPRPCNYKGLSLVLLPMDLADGGSLRHWMRKNRDIESRREAGLDLFRQACLGVKAIHDAGLAHLDIKPENILLVDGAAKVTDFGIGRYVDRRFAENPEQLLRQGVGTPQYMSPEQFRTARQAEVGPASDIYSLGLVLYELLDGSPPFDGNRHELRDKHLSMSPPELRGKAAPWWPVVQRCLAKEPHQRYANVQQLVQQVDRAAAGDAVSADASCPECGHLNVHERNESCEKCRGDLSSLFRECPKCGRRNRLDLERCGGCSFEIAAHHLFEQRRMQVAQLKDEDPVAAIEILELMIRSGAGEREVALVRELRQKQAKIAPWIAQAREKVVSGQAEEAMALWREVLMVIPRHRTAMTELERLEPLIALFNSSCSMAMEALNGARFEEAERFLQSCLEMIPQHEEVATRLAEARARARRYAEIMAEATAARKARLLRRARDQAQSLLSIREQVSPGDELGQSICRCARGMRGSRPVRWLYGRTAG